MFTDHYINELQFKLEVNNSPMKEVVSDGLSRKLISKS